MEVLSGWLSWLGDCNILDLSAREAKGLKSPKDIPLIFLATEIGTSGSAKAGSSIGWEPQKEVSRSIHDGDGDRPPKDPASEPREDNRLRRPGWGGNKKSAQLSGIGDFLSPLFKSGWGAEVKDERWDMQSFTGARSLSKSELPLPLRSARSLKSLIIPNSSLEDRLNVFWSLKLDDKHKIINAWQYDSMI